MLVVFLSLLEVPKVLYQKKQSSYFFEILPDSTIYLLHSFFNNTHAYITYMIVGEHYLLYIKVSTLWGFQHY